MLDQQTGAARGYSIEVMVSLLRQREPHVVNASWLGGVSPARLCISCVTANALSQRLRWEGAAKGWRVRRPMPIVLAHWYAGFWRLPCARGHKGEMYQHLCRADV